MSGSNNGYAYGYMQSVAGNYTSIVTVTSPAANYDLASIAQVKTLLGINDDSQDTKLTLLITAVSTTFLKLIGRVLAEETVSEKFRIIGSVSTLQLSRYPVSAIASVTEDGTLLDNTEYEVDPASGLLSRLNSDFQTPWCSRAVTAVYTGGYPLPPDNLVQEVASQVNHALSIAGRDPSAKMIQIPDILTTEYWVGDSNDSPTGLPANTLAVLKSYRMVRF